ncbi:MAG: (2Fe-2S)-binding protein [Betaproteobacteria bacterium]|jgi:carbon-monoxide dehydrogenase small subunit|nr:(2Fe-2S)-binding protein [Betaproteobacteria bacterium]MCC6249091.1 (2Fe-2S)-binding protein [Rubrivivax sp.]
MPTLSFKLNGQPVSAEVENPTLLVDLLRTQLGLTGTHIGCDTAQCGCCTVMIDGLAVKSCSQLAMQAAGRDVTTIEGLAGEGGRLHPVQEAFVACHGLQCGYCTPGMVMSAVALLAHNARPSEAEIVDALEGNLCRCTGYVNIVAAVQQAAATMAAGSAKASHPAEAAR